MQSSLSVLICLLSWCGLGACRACHDKAKFTETVFICVFYCVFGIGDFAGSSVRKASFFHLFAKSPLLVFYISKGSISRPFYDVGGWPDLHGFEGKSGGTRRTREGNGGDSWAKTQGITSKTCKDLHPTTTLKREAFRSKNQSQSYS